MASPPKWMFLRLIAGTYKFYSAPDTLAALTFIRNWGTTADPYTVHDMSVNSGHYQGADESPGTGQTFMLCQKYFDSATGDDWFQLIPILTSAFVRGALTEVNDDFYPLTNWRQWHNARDLYGGIAVCDAPKKRLWFGAFEGVSPTYKYNIKSTLYNYNWKEIDDYHFQAPLKTGLLTALLYGDTSMVESPEAFLGYEEWRFNYPDFVQRPTGPTMPTSFPSKYLFTAVNWLTPPQALAASGFGLGNDRVWFTLKVHPSTKGFYVGMWVVFNSVDTDWYKITDTVETLPGSYEIEVTPNLRTNLASSSTIEQCVPPFIAPIELNVITGITDTDDNTYSSGGYTAGTNLLTELYGSGWLESYAVDDYIGVIAEDYYSQQGNNSTTIWDTVTHGNYRVKARYVRYDSVNKVEARIEKYNSSTMTWNYVGGDYGATAGTALGSAGNFQVYVYSINSITNKAQFLWGEPSFAQPAWDSSHIITNKTSTTLTISPGLKKNYTEESLRIYKVNSQVWSDKEWFIYGSEDAYTFEYAVYREQYSHNQGASSLADLDEQVIAFDETKDLTDKYAQQYQINSGSTASPHWLNLKSPPQIGIAANGQIQRLIAPKGGAFNIDNEVVQVEYGDGDEMYVLEYPAKVVRRLEYYNETDWTQGVYIVWTLSITGIASVNNHIFYFKNYLYVNFGIYVWKVDTVTGLNSLNFGGIGTHAQIDQNGYLCVLAGNSIDRYNVDTGVKVDTKLSALVTGTVGMVLVPGQRPELSSLIINSGDTYTNDADVTIALTYNASYASPTEVRFLSAHKVGEAWIDDGWSAWETYAASISFTLVGADNTKRVTGQLRNAYGTGAPKKIDTIILDTDAPKTPAVLINGGNAYTNTVSVNLLLTATNPVSVPLQMKISNLSDLSGASWETFATGKAWTLLAGPDGNRIVYARFRDGALNETGIVNDNIALDTYAPTNVVVLINSGDYTTTNLNVTLEISADGTPAEMLLSNSVSFAGATWETYATVKSWSFTGGVGTKTVYLKVRDLALNEGGPVSDSIYYYTGEDDLVEVGTIIGNVDLSVVSIYQSADAVIRPPYIILKVSFINSLLVTKGLALGKLYLQNEDGNTADKVIYLSDAEVYRTVFAQSVEAVEGEVGQFRCEGIIELRPQQWIDVKTYTINFKLYPEGSNGADKIAYLTVTFDLENKVYLSVANDNIVRILYSSLESNTDYKLRIQGVKSADGSLEINDEEVPFTTPTMPEYHRM